MKNKPKTNVQIIDYSDKYQAAFRALNEERTSKQYAINFSIVHFSRHHV